MAEVATESSESPSLAVRGWGRRWSSWGNRDGIWGFSVFPEMDPGGLDGGSRAGAGGSIVGTLAVVTALIICKLGRKLWQVVLSRVLPRCQTHSEKLRGLRQLAGA